jgi:hypothetical protein
VWTLREEIMLITEPVRVERSYTQKINARPEEVFPLLCPVRETEWVAGWEPVVVYTKSGLAEPDCIFVTSDEEAEPIWVVTQHDPDAHKLEMIKITPGFTVGKISISLTLNENNGTDALVRYIYTALSREGEEFVYGYSEEFFCNFMRVWEETLNDFVAKRL